MPLYPPSPPSQINAIPMTGVARPGNPFFISHVAVAHVRLDKLISPCKPSY